MTIPIPPDPYSAASSTASSGAAASILPGSALGASSMTLNTSVVNVSSNVASGVFGYEGIPGQSSILFSLAPQAGTDSFGNTYPTGLSVSQGQITGVNMTGVTIDSTSNLLGSLLQNGQISATAISGGTATSTVHVLNQQGGAVLGYTNVGATVTFSTAGTYLWTAPTNITQAKVECWGAGAGGGGGSGPGGQAGGEGGGGGEYAAENTLVVTPGSVYQVTVGQGGAGGHTNLPGQSGTDSVFTDPQGNNLVYAFGGQAGLNFQGGSGGLGSNNTTEEPGGAGASGSGFSGGGGGGSSGGSSAPGNAGAISTGSTGGAGGSAPSGGGAGGAGGNNAANGTSGSSPGGAGGGAGQAAGLGAVSKVYYPTQTLSYFGSQHNPPNYQRTVNTSVFHGNGSNSLSTTGDQYGFILYNWHQIRSDLSGATINSVTLHLSNLGTYYAGGSLIAIGYTTYTGSFGLTFIPGGGTHEAQSTVHVNRNSSVQYDITSWMSSHIASDFTGIILGPTGSFSSNPGSFLAYAYFYGYASNNNGNTPYLTVNYNPAGSTPQNAGNGSDGQVKITYGSTSTPNSSVSPSGGTDVFGNAYPAGLVAIHFGTDYANLVDNGTNAQLSFGASGSSADAVVTRAAAGVLNTNAAVQYQDLATPSATANVSTVYSGSGNLKYVSGTSGDASAYNTGRHTVQATSTTSITSTTPTNITGLSVNVGAITYRVCGVIIGVVGGSGTTQSQTIRFSGTSTVSSMRIVVNSVVASGGQTSNYGTITAFGADPSTVFGGAGPGLNATMIFEFSGIVTFSGSGTFLVQGREVTSGADVGWTVQTQSWLEVLPIT